MYKTCLMPKEMAIELRIVQTVTKLRTTFQNYVSLLTIILIVNEKKNISFSDFGFRKIYATRTNSNEKPIIQ